MKFFSKPATIEAEQWLRQQIIPRGIRVRVEAGSSDKVEWFVTTIHGNDVVLELGDWVVAEPDGVHFYPVKPDIFEKRWESEPQKFTCPDCMADLALESGKLVCKGHES